MQLMRQMVELNINILKQYKQTESKENFLTVDSAYYNFFKNF